MGSSRIISENGNNEIQPTVDRNGRATRRWRRKNKNAVSPVDSSGVRSALGSITGSNTEKRGETKEKRSILNKVLFSGYSTAGAVAVVGLSLLGLTSGLATSAIFFFSYGIRFRPGSFVDSIESNVFPWR